MAKRAQVCIPYYIVQCLCRHLSMRVPHSRCKPHIHLGSVACTRTVQQVKHTLQHNAWCYIDRLAGTLQQSTDIVCALHNVAGEVLQQPMATRPACTRTCSLLQHVATLCLSAVRNHACAHSMRHSNAKPAYSPPMLYNIMQCQQMFQ